MEGVKTVFSMSKMMHFILLYETLTESRKDKIVKISVN